MRSRYTAFVIHDISHIQKTVAGEAAVLFSLMKRYAGHMLFCGRGFKY